MKVIARLAIGFICFGLAYIAVQSWNDRTSFAKVKESADVQWQKTQSIPFDKREEYAREESKKSLQSAPSTKSAKERAAGMFFGWRLRNTEGYAAECRQWNVNLDPWISRINSTLWAENTKLDVVFAGRESDIEKIRQILLPKILPDAAQELHVMASRENLTMVQACQALNNVALDTSLWNELWPEVSPWKTLPEAMQILMR